MNKKSIILSCIITLAVLASFFIGLLIGSYTKPFSRHKSKKSKYVSFYSVKKHLGEETSDKEKQAIKMFIIPYEECFRNSLNEEEKNAIKNIQEEVIDMAKENTKIKFKINELDAYKNNVNSKIAVKKTRKCQKQAYKHMTKTDKRLFRSGLSKMSIDNVISIFHGIR